MSLDDVRLMLAGALMFLGAVFMVLSGLGLWRMHDFLMRMSTTTKASTLGVSLIFGGAILYFGDAFGVDVSARAAATLIFLFLTTPVGAHMIARAGYLSKNELWDKTQVDEFKAYVDAHQGKDSF